MVVPKEPINDDAAVVGLIEYKDVGDEPKRDPFADEARSVMFPIPVDPIRVDNPVSGFTEYNREFDFEGVHKEARVGGRHGAETSKRRREM